MKSKARKKIMQHLHKYSEHEFENLNKTFESKTKLKRLVKSHKKRNYFSY